GVGERGGGAAQLAGGLDVLETTLQLLAAVRPRRDAGQPAGPDDEEDDDRAEDFAALAARAATIRDELRMLIRASDDEYVYFVEFRGRGVFLRASPIDVSAIVRALLIDRMRTTILTSATLTVDGAFDYIRTRLGIGDADEVRLPSEFDFTRQAIL